MFGRFARSRAASTTSLVPRSESKVERSIRPVKTMNAMETMPPALTPGPMNRVSEKMPEDGVRF